MTNIDVIVFQVRYLHSPISSHQPANFIVPEAGNTMVQRKGRYRQQRRTERQERVIIDNYCGHAGKIQYPGKRTRLEKCQHSLYPGLSLLLANYDVKISTLFIPELYMALRSAENIKALG